MIISINKRRYLYVCILLLCLGQKINACASSVKQARVTIMVNDKQFRQGLVITFVIYQNGVNSNHPVATKSYVLKINQRVNTISIPLSTNINYGRIALWKDSTSFKDWDLPLDNSDNLFLFENNDQVAITLNSHKFGAEFSGNSKAKFKKMYTINNVSDDLINRRYNYFMQLNDREHAMNSIKQGYDSLLVVKNAIIDSAKTKINAKVIRLIKLDNWAFCNQNVVGRCMSPFLGKKQLWLAETKKFYIQTYERLFTLPEASEEKLAFSYFVGDFLAYRSKTYAVISRSDAKFSFFKDLKFREINDAVSLQYKNGILKDRVMLGAFLNVDRIREPDFVDYTNKAAQEAKRSTIKDVLISLYNANLLGSNAYQFSLNNEHEKQVSLNDFKGKLVVMDFWFTGCSGCLTLAKSMKPLIEAYADENVVFISVSVDRSKSSWLESLKQGKYTSGKEVNLIAENGWQSDILQHYNIDAYPTLIIISTDGKIISTAPPDPRYDLIAFKKLVNQSL